MLVLMLCIQVASSYMAILVLFTSVMCLVFSVSASTRISLLTFSGALSAMVNVKSFIQGSSFFL